MKLKDSFLRLLQQINTYGRSSLLQPIPWKDLSRVDHAAARNSYVARRRNEAIRACKVVLRDIGDYQAQQQLAQIIGEIRIYIALRQLVPVEAIPESGDSTPDFRIGVSSRALHAEAKVLMPADVTASQRNEMEESLTWLSSVERKPGLHVRESVSSPFKRHDKPYDPRSPKLVAEVLIEKMQQNIKTTQFSRGRTVLIVSLEHLLTIVPPAMAIRRKFRDPETGGTGTGELWVAAAGKRGEQAVRAPEFSGEQPAPETIEKEGILSAHPVIVGVTYFSAGQFYSIVNRKRLNGATAVLINQFSRYVIADTG